MAKTFKVGDKVRILDVSKIAGGNAHWSNGDIAEVLDVRECDGGLRLTRVKTGTYNGFGPIVIRGEHAGIELVDASPMKKQRIKALENEVEALKARIEALEKAKEIDISARIAEKKTPNQRRKAVIERAKAFVADVEERAKSYDTIPEYHVKKEKRVVTVLVKAIHSGGLLKKAIARCAPGDVFNEHIGKAIALAKAYGLECPKEFTDAPQPEIAVGQYVNVKGNYGAYKDVVTSELGKNHSYEKLTNRGGLIAILDDTGAQYE